MSVLFLMLNQIKQNVIDLFLNRHNTAIIILFGFHLFSSYNGIELLATETVAQKEE